MRVQRAGGTSAVRDVSVMSASPGIFSTNRQGTGAGAILHADTYQLVSNSNPTRPGGLLAIYCTGLGQLQTPVPFGSIAPTPPPETLATPQVSIAGIPATVQFSGLAPGFVGLYQVNVQVPARVPAGAQNLQIVINGVPSNTVTVAVQ